MMYKNILVIGHSNFGDVTYDLVVIDPLMKAYPGAKISFLTSSKSQELVEGYPGISRIFIFDRHAKDKGWAGRFNFMRRLRNEKFDLAVVLNSTYMHKFLKIPEVWAAKKRSDRHTVDIYLELLKSKGIMVIGPVFNFTFTSAQNEFADKFFLDNGMSGKTAAIGILPLANWSLKCWHIENWNRLIKALMEQDDVKVIAFGKSSNDQYTQEALKKISPAAVSAVDKCTLKESMSLMARCRVFISADTSLLHLASCLNVSCIGLFGATPASRFYPYFSREKTIASGAGLSCMPCSGTRNFARCKAAGGLAPCMEDITIEQVLDQVKMILKESK